MLVEQKRNIGNNQIITCGSEKKVIGIKKTRQLVFLLLFGLLGTFTLWIISTFNFLSYYFYLIGCCFFILTALNLILSYITEPGIIPRNHPDYIKKDNEENEIQITDSSEKNIIPSIFTRRVCSTCGIIRPPKASHCSTCDNCVQNFDHHCIYISNCVGERNHRFFFLMLYFGLLYTLFIFGMSLFHFLSMLLDKNFSEKSIVVNLATNQPVLFYISFLLIIFSVIPFFVNFGYITVGLFGIGYAMFLYIFYSNKPYGTPFYYNMFSVPNIIISICFSQFILVNFCKALRIVLIGFTTKQQISIHKEYMNQLSQNKNPELTIQNEYIRKRTCKEKVNNLFKFLFTFNHTKSLIESKRDL